MIALIGIITIFVMVFGGYTIAGGKMAIILHTLPHEMMIIGGAALGAFLISNKIARIKAVLKGFSKVFSGSKWKQSDYLDILSLLFIITRTIRSKGMVALESHIEKPEESPIFQLYPKILHDHFATAFICDTLRMMTMNLDDPMQVETIMQNQMDIHHHDAHGTAHAVQSMADGVPALGIVAAVLGVIKTMASITEPPEVLGHMIGGALVGTFMGVFLAYGFISPFAAKMQDVYDEEGLLYQIIRDVLVAHLHSNAPPVSIAIGRGNIPGYLQPSFARVEEALNEAAEKTKTLVG